MSVRSAPEVAALGRGEMSVRPDSGKIISFITESAVIRQILEHLNLWAEKLSRDPPEWKRLIEDSGVVREPFDDGWGNYDEYSPSSYIA